MRIMIVGNVFGDFYKLKEDAQFIEADIILISGNVGIKTDTSFLDYWEDRLKIRQPIYFITGKHEDFGVVKEIEEAPNLTQKMRRLSPYALNIDPIDHNEDDKYGSFDIKVAGVSGTYSEKWYEEKNAPPRHFTKNNLRAVSEEANIVLLHNVPGKLGKMHSLNFEDDFFRFVEQKAPQYLFVGGYGYLNYSCFPYCKTTVIFLPPLTRGYALIDTKDWSCYFNNKMN